MICLFYFASFRIFGICGSYKFCRRKIYMENFEIYNDIAKRTNGDIYIGIVGPVRTGKSTFITKFMRSGLLDNIINENEKQRTIDEMPQSGSGKTIMTMQPKFIPSEAVEVSFGEGAKARVRLVDCVGYAIEGAGGFEEDGMPRLVKTPWNETEIPFEEAAEIGTRKVITEHSTIAVLVTTDGSITNIPRESYVQAEERVVRELKQAGKPFVIVLNSTNPNSEENKKLASSLQEKYGSPVLNYNVSKLSPAEINEIVKNVLMEFPVSEIRFNLPKWIRALPFDNELIKNLMETIKEKTQNISKISEYKLFSNVFLENNDFKNPTIENMDLSNGVVSFNIPVSETLYYKTLSSACGIEIQDDFHLMSYLKDLVSAKKEYDKIKLALQSVNETGYGVVNPSIEDLELYEPEIVTKGSNSSLKLKAKASSLHIIKVDVESEICPAVGSGEQGGSLVTYMMNEFESNKQEIWNKNMFGKPMNELVKESIDSKIAGLPQDVQTKMRKTLTKIVNERKGGIICILL